jgi:glycosyltransferase involved in cell wall biosynthesis
MRILMLSSYPGVRGPIHRCVSVLVDALRTLDCDVVNESWGCHHDHESVLEKAYTRIGDIVRIRRVLARRRFDVMVVNTSHDWRSLTRDIPLLLVARHLCGRTVVQFHGGQSDRLVARGDLLFKAASALLLRLADGVLVLSSEEQRCLQRFSPRGRFYVVANAFRPTFEAQRGEGRLRWSLGERVATVLFVGRLIREKGIFDTLDALARVNHGTNWQLLIAGDGPEIESVRERTLSLHLADRVTITGYITGDTLGDAYGAADLFVLPTYWPEGFPTVLAEAMHAGLPIITTKTRGIGDHLVEGVNAVFVPALAPAAIAEAVEGLLASPSTRARMAQANREKVKEFAPNVVALRYLEALREIVA